MDKRSDYLYHLPEDRIAQKPVEPRDASKLLILDRSRDQLEHRIFRDLPEYLREGDTLVFNDTRVIPARLHGQRPTGGHVELLLLEEISSAVWTTLARPAKRLLTGTTIQFSGGWTATVIEEGESGRRTVRFNPPGAAEYSHSDFILWLESAGATPLPPYIHREPGPEDRERYQTVYAEHEGSVAAPTAGLHFTPEQIDQIQEMGVDIARLTLHVGIGTFRPVEIEDLSNHVMDEERYQVSEDAAETINRNKERGGRVIAVGTTSVRTLESIANESGHVQPGFGRTDLFIRPPYRYKAVDGMITNFHLPGSTLIMLVSALAGRDRVLQAYEEAIKLDYRFFSYGDAMLIV